MGLKDIPKGTPRPTPARPSALRPDPAKDPYILGLLAYGTARDGDLAGLQTQASQDLRKLGLAEFHPKRLSHLGNPSSSGYGALHKGLRLTRAGFEAAGHPHRAGRAWFVARAETHVPGRGILLMVKGGRLQTSMSELVAARSPPAKFDAKGMPVWQPPRIPDVTAFETHDDPGDALDAVERLVGRAEALSGAPSILLDPAQVSWDGLRFSMEDMGPDGASFEPVPIRDVLERMRETLIPPSPGYR